MGHFVQAIIGKRPLLDRIVAKYREPTPVIELAQDLCLLPLSPELYDSLPEGPIVSWPELEHSFLYFPSGKLQKLLVEDSEHGMLAYIETEYFGGSGDQMALVGHHGKLAFGPKNGKDSINAALRLLGVVSSHGRDEFDTLGLGTRRSTERWMES